MKRYLVLSFVLGAISFASPSRASEQPASAHKTITLHLTLTMRGTYVLGQSVTANGIITPFGSAKLNAAISGSTGDLTFTFLAGATAPPRCCGSSSTISGDAFLAIGHASGGGASCALDAVVAGGTGVFGNASGTLALSYSPCGPSIPPKGPIQISGTGSMVLNCDLPSGEITAFDSWGATIGYWKQTLLSADNIGFSGSTVTETEPAAGTDSCWFDGSAFAPFIHLTGGTWNVEADNTWGFDAVGWNPSPVAYYRHHHRAPCGATLFQQMTIKCSDGSTYDYGPVNTLRGVIASKTVQSGRAGKVKTEVY